MLRIAVLIAALAASTAAARAEWSSEWVEKKAPDAFVQLSNERIEHSGVRVESCHLEWYNFGSFEAVPKCYVINTSGKPVRVRIDFVLMDKGRETVVAATLARGWAFPDMTGAELETHVPMTEGDADRVTAGKVRAVIASP